MSRFLLAIGLVIVFASATFAQQPASDTTKEVITSATSTSYDARSTHKTWDGLIYTDVFGLFSQGNIASMFRIGDHFAAGGGFHIPTPIISEKGFGVTAEGRWYPGKHALSGFYLGPNFTFNLYKRSDSSANAVSAGLLVAYEWISKGNVALGVAGGADYFSLKRKPTYLLLDESGITPAFRFDFGIAW